jgi:DNA-binding transcriptional ArsR family regulator
MILLHIRHMDDRLDRVFKALGDPTRRRIIDGLSARPGQSLFEICSHLVSKGGSTISRQAVTQHLDLLEKAGLIRVEWAGRTKLHMLDLAPLREAVDAWLRHHVKLGESE